MRRVKKKPGRDSHLRAIWSSLLITMFMLVLQSGCAQLQLPAIDPTGNSIFLPRPFSTRVLGHSETNPLRGPNTGRPPVISFPQTGSAVNPGFVNQPIQVAQNPFARPQSQFGAAAPIAQGSIPMGPAFRAPADAPPCDPREVTARRHVIPHPREPVTNAELGKIITTPARIVAPVGSEVVVLAGICGPDARFAINQPLEFMLSNDSVGQIIEVGGTDKKAYNRFIGPAARKFDGQYAWGRTGHKEKLLTRGTPTPVDDIQLLKGQTFLSLSSASPGTTYLTSVAPKAAAWDKRKQTTKIHWIDGTWAIPTPTTATSGTVHPMTTRVLSARGDEGVPDWKVKYTIVGGAPAEFAPAGSQTAEAVTGPDGMATVQIRQPSGQFNPGTTQVRVDVVRPRQYGEPELVVESGITAVTWSAPQITIRAIGPKTAKVNDPFNYRIEVSNPGDQVARGVVVSTRDLNGDVEYISSTPKPTEYGNQYQWNLGDIQPRSAPQIIDVQMKSEQLGNALLCFDVSSQTDGLQTEACAQTEIDTPCIGLDVNGPTDVIVGEEIDFNLLVSNLCNESLRDVVLEVTFDSGLQVPNQGRKIRYPIASLPYGQVEEVPLQFVATQPGRHCYYLSIGDADGNENQSKICVTARTADGGVGVDQGGQDGSSGGDVPIDNSQNPGGAGSGSTTDSSPVSLRFAGQQQIRDGAVGLVRAVVRNESDSPIEDIILTNRFSPSLNPVEVTASYPQGWLGSDLAFNIGTLQPGEEALVEIQFEGVQPDIDAFSEMSVTSRSGEISTTKRFDMSVAPAEQTNEPPIGIPQDGDAGGLVPEGPVNGAGREPVGQNTGGQPGDSLGAPSGEPPIGIPDDGGVTGRGLIIDVQTLDPSVNVGDEARIAFTIKNDRIGTDENVNISMLVPPSLKLVAYDDSQFDLALKDKTADETEFRFETRNQMRPGEEITFVAVVETVQAGTSTFEVQATSANSIGAITGSDTVFAQ